MESDLTRAMREVFETTYKLSLNRNYVSRWGVVDAIRELIQNALDSDSPFKYEFLHQGNGSYALTLSSEHTVLQPRTLLLGVTSKEDNPNAIGSFGEGFKIALLVLARNGYDVRMFNGTHIWAPRFQHDARFGEELLCIIETDNDNKEHRGLTFLIPGLDDQSVDEIRASCLLMQETVGEVHSTQWGDILLERPGCLFVGNLFVCTTDFKYGYNIHPRYVTLERDRRTVSSWQLGEITTKMWYTRPVDVVAQMIQDELLDVAYARYNAPELLKEECYKIFRKNNPGALIASSAHEMQEAVKKGMTKTVYVGGFMYDAVSSSKSYRQEAPSLIKKVATPHEILTDWFRTHRSEMRTPAIKSFKELLATTTDWVQGR